MCASSCCRNSDEFRPWHNTMCICRTHTCPFSFLSRVILLPHPLARTNMIPGSLWTLNTAANDIPILYDWTVDYDGHDLSIPGDWSDPVGSIEECVRRCDTSPTCLFWGFATDINACMFKSSDAGLTLNQRARTCGKCMGKRLFGLLIG